MCGRFSLVSTPEEVQSLFGYDDKPNFPPRFNIAPTQPIAVVNEKNGAPHFMLARWGLIPGWVKDTKAFPLLINARSETVFEKPAFRSAIRRKRCLIPANGFYEWKRDGDTKRPFWCAAPDGSLLAFAGLWEDWASADGSEIDTATILTIEANETLKPIHHRMPILVHQNDFAAWLDPNAQERDIRPLLQTPANDAFVPVPVSNRVNSVKNDDADLQTEIEAQEIAKPSKRDRKGKDDDQFSLF